MKFVINRSRHMPVILLALLLVFVKPLLVNNSSNLNKPTSGTAGDTDPSVSYDLTFSTFLGGSGLDHARDVHVDSQGFVYIAGGTKSVDFPHTIGPAFNSALCGTLGTGGQSDGFIAKYSPHGQLVWSPLLGGPWFDRV